MNHSQEDEKITFAMRTCSKSLLRQKAAQPHKGKGS